MTDNTLANIPPLQKALALAAEAGDVDALKDVRAMGTALQRGAKARGMGVDAENAAAEVVLRSERAIGQTLLKMREEGVLAAQGDAPKRGNRFVRGLPPKSGPTPELTVADLPFTQHNVSDFTTLARLPDETFETMLNEAKNLRERIAKVNFYRRPADPKKEGPATKDESGWDEFLRGANALLGWHVDEDGQGRFAKNGLLQLPNDQLLTLAVIVRELVRCYQEVKEQR